MKFGKSRIIPSLWTFAVLFYLLRSIAEPMKYLFFISFGILLLSYFYYFITNLKKTSIMKFFFASKEFQILGLFLASGILLSSRFETLSIKSLINFVGITVLYLIYFEYKDHINLVKFFKGWLILTLFIGILGLFKWLNFLLELNLDFFSIFYRSGSSLVSEYNFYACYFIISAIIYFYALHKNVVQGKLFANLAILFLFLINITLSGSRRGIILLAIAFIVANIVLVLRKKGRHQSLHKNLSYLNALLCILLIIFTILIPFRSKIITKKSTQTKIAVTLYRYNRIFSPGITYSSHYNMVWPKSRAYENDRTNWIKYASYNNLVEDKNMNKYVNLKAEYWRNFDKQTNVDNLFYNGDFFYGQKFWGINAPDSVKHEIITTSYGKAIRVSRAQGTGWWPLEYDGREIIYFEGVTYTIKFKYRVIKGSGQPFKIGWWVNEGDGHKNNLHGNIRKLNEDWFEFTASYKFKGDRYNLKTFMNSQQANSIIDFADIELTCNDTLDRPKYLDQLLTLEGHNLLYNSNFEHGLKFWTTTTYDAIDHELIETEYGKAIRVTRKEGNGYFSLAYQGRSIYYYKDLTYFFRFKFRVIKGEDTPFNIGWWLQGEEQKQHNLHKDIFPLNDEWFECIASHKFEQDYYGRITTFMNSQKSNTVVDFADIELICNDRQNRSMYADENIEKIRVLEELNKNQQPGYEKGKLLSERVNRWKYALELWQSEYRWYQKLFGGGFDYLRKFGEKFYPEEDRIDYPHNPIISSFLYSGLLGGFFYIYFLGLSFWYYWKYRKHHLLFFILYLITFAFVFISSDSHFNVPVFAMLSLVPFITKYVVKEKEQKNPI